MLNSQKNIITHNENILKGVMICFLAYLFVALMGVCEKALPKTIEIPLVLFFQNVLKLLITQPVYWKINPSLSFIETTEIIREY